MAGGTDAVNVDAQPPAGGVAVEIGLTDVTGGKIAADVTVEVDKALLAPGTIDLNKSLRLIITPTAGDQVTELPAGFIASSTPIELLTQGSVSTWPFDHYSGGLIVSVTDTQGHPIPFVTSISGKVSGWRIWAESSSMVDALKLDGEAAKAASRQVDSRNVQAFTITAARSGSQIVFAVIMLLVLIATAAVVGMLAWQVANDRRRAEPAFFGFAAAVLFSTVTLRRFFPGDPPVGILADALVVLWVIVITVLALAAIAYAWNRHSGPPILTEPPEAQEEKS